MFKKFFLHEGNMLVAIAVNSLIIFLLYFPQIEKGNPGLFLALEAIDFLFIVIFLIEAIIKLRVYGIKDYFANGWNKFDFIIIVASLPSLLALFPFIHLPNTSFLKILRLGRMVRLLRFVSFIPRMEMILNGLSRALKASVFVMIALIFLNFILALFTCHFYGEVASEYFGDPAIASYYIFQMFTVEGWNEIPAMVVKNIHSSGEDYYPFSAGLTRFYFIMVVLFGGIFGMSLANAVFVDEMTMDNNDGLEDKIDNLEAQIIELKGLLTKNNE